MLRNRVWMGAVLAACVMAGSPAHGAPVRTPVTQLCEEYWQGYLKANPTRATELGDRRYDAELPDISPEGRSRENIRLSDLLDRADAFDSTDLSPADRLNRSALMEELRGQLALRTCGFEEWVVDAINGPQTEFNSLPELTRIDSPQDAKNYVLRLKAMPAYYDQYIRNLDGGLTRRRVATRAAIERVIAMLDQQRSTPIEDWPLYRPVTQPHPKWPAADRGAFENDVEQVLGYELQPALERYRAFLASSLLPYARPPERAGIVNLPGGLESYGKCARVHTSIQFTPQDIHNIGLESVQRVRAEMSALGASALGTSDVSEIQRRLRGDSTMYFATAAQIEDKARATLGRARDAIPTWFGILPRTDCQVRVIDPLEAPNSYVAYYRQGSPDGTRPGYYMVNTFRPTTRTRYEAEALAFHESIPGHHLQIAIAQQLTDLPAFRREQGVTAFVEGWALYSERLANEMGLYSSDIDRLGMLSYDAWRSCRLVVDTGIHALGWSRQQAIDYMRENTLLAENNIENEVDRYINWPGQALAYKLGQIEIQGLRDAAQRKLGDRFDIREFHDVVLRNGAVTLPVLREQVEAWMLNRAAQE